MDSLLHTRFSYYLQNKKCLGNNLLYLSTQNTVEKAVPVCLPSGEQWVLVGTAGLEGRPVPLVSAQLKLTPALLELGI